MVQCTKGLRIQFRRSGGSLQLPVGSWTRDIRSFYRDQQTSKPSSLRPLSEECLGSTGSHGLSNSEKDTAKDLPGQTIPLI